METHTQEGGHPFYQLLKITGINQRKDDLFSFRHLFAFTQRLH